MSLFLRLSDSLSLRRILITNRLSFSIPAIELFYCLSSLSLSLSLSKTLYCFLGTSNLGGEWRYRKRPFWWPAGLGSLALTRWFSFSRRGFGFLLSIISTIRLWKLLIGFGKWWDPSFLRNSNSFWYQIPVLCLSGICCVWFPKIFGR